MQWVPTLRNRPRQSEREAQILDGLVRGHANKVIARSSDNTEAVHMKSILQKIQVANRTQAAGRWSTAILPTKLKAAC